MRGKMICFTCRFKRPPCAVLFVPSFRQHIAKAIECKMRSYMCLFTVRDIDELCFCQAEILMIKTAVLQDFTGCQTNLSALWKITVKLHPSGQILSKIQYRFPLWRYDHFNGGKRLLFYDRQAVALCQFTAFFRHSTHRRADFLRLFQPGIINLTVIDAAENDRRHAGCPVRPCCRDQLSVYVELRDRIQTITIQILHTAVKSKAALKPPFAKPDLNLIFTWIQIRTHVIDVRLQVEIIGMIPWRQILVTHFFPIDIAFIHTQSTDIQTRILYFLQHLKFFFQNIASHGICLCNFPARRDPLCSPCFL